MVTFYIESKDAAQVIYKYFPEDHMDKAFGLIRVDLVREEITVKVVAEEDFDKGTVPEKGTVAWY
jgi:hypothetical protein